MTPPRPAPPRQARARKTRDALLAAVEKVVASEGPDAVTTTRIASETGVAVGTIYRYFSDREALLLAAYDETVARIVAQCRSELETLNVAMGAENAARTILRAYLAAAERTPAHSGLLAAMRAIRPIDAGQRNTEAMDIARDLLAPFLERFAISGTDDCRLNFLSVLLGTLVDLYLVTEDEDHRLRLGEELEAHMLLALNRLSNKP